MPVIDGNDLFVTGGDLDELLGHGSVGGLPAGSSEVGAGGIDSLINLVISADSPDITVTDVTNGNVEEGLWTEVLPSVTLRHLSSDTSSHGSNAISSDDPEEASPAAVDGRGNDVLNEHPVGALSEIVLDTGSDVEIIIIIKDKEISISTHSSRFGVMVTWVSKLNPAITHWGLSGYTGTEVSVTVGLSTNESAVSTDVDLEQESIFDEGPA